ncbi:YihY/virulence factor BrkB family protein [Candidatus Protochlamydia phocaeensis]|uniref:YihY/virulence factor BrkB family protein n=1 Tax=Candidatus Protochlamydia phocaeensis TaxID=1414722 RepID=UPI00083855F8|nr:YihY/virulence factor BrkB family protein [Candidatus Protochlamydia phocaeensis]
MKKKFKKIIDFFREDIWEERDEKNPLKRFFYRFLRILLASVQGFIADKGFDKASTLTFYFLLSLIPIVAIGFGIAQELGFEERFTEQVKKQFLTQPQVAEKIIEFAHSTLKQAKGGIIAGFGFALLLWTVIRMIGNIAFLFNEIWKIKKPPTLWQQIKSYIPMILCFPIFLVGSSSFIFYLSAYAISTVKSVEFLSFFSSAVGYFFQILSYLISWSFLSFIYIYLPNTRVCWKAGFLAGIFTGIIYVFWQWVYVKFQINVASYGAIYGSFAAFPLFLFWLNYSWLILIFGAEVCYHIQHEGDLIKKDKKGTVFNTAS